MPAFIPVHPPRNPDECPGWLYEALTRLNRHATSGAQATAALVRGEIPDSSGTPLPAPDLTDYFKLSGRATTPSALTTPGQLAYGATTGAGQLTLASTSAATKGKIYLGVAQTTAYDEANDWFGFGLNAPVARVDIKKDTNSVYINFTQTTYTFTATTTSGSTDLTSISGISVLPTAGMALSGTNIQSGSYVYRTLTATTLRMNKTATGNGSVTVTVTPANTIGQVTDLTGQQDVTMDARGAFRFVMGPPDSSANRSIWRLYADQGPIGQSSGGAVSDRVFHEFGYMAGGGAANGAQTLQIGGPNKGEVAQMNILARWLWLSRNPAISGGISVVLGALNPGDWSGSSPTFVSRANLVIHGPSSTEGILINGSGTGGFAQVLTLRSPATGGAGTLSPAEMTFAITGDATLSWFTGTVDAEVRAFLLGRTQLNSGNGARHGLRMVDQQANPSGGTFANNNVFYIGRSLEWSTVDVSPTFTTRFDFGDNLRGMLAGHQGAMLTRFGIATTFCTISNRTSVNMPLGLALLHLDRSDDGIVQMLSTSTTLTANWFEIRDSSSTKLAVITPRGAWAGHTDIVTWEDEVLSYEDDTVYYN